MKTDQKWLEQQKTDAAAGLIGHQIGFEPLTARERYRRVRRIDKIEKLLRADDTQTP